MQSFGRATELVYHPANPITGDETSVTVVLEDYTPTIEEIEACLACLYHGDNPELSAWEIADQIDELVSLLDELAASGPS